MIAFVINGIERMYYDIFLTNGTIWQYRIFGFPILVSFLWAVVSIDQ